MPSCASCRSTFWRIWENFRLVIHHRFHLVDRPQPSYQDGLLLLLGEHISLHNVIPKGRVLVYLVSNFFGKHKVYQIDKYSSIQQSKIFQFFRQTFKEIDFWISGQIFKESFWVFTKPRAITDIKSLQITNLWSKN